MLVLILENVRSTSVLSKIHKMFLRFYSRSHNSITSGTTLWHSHCHKKLLVNLLDPILLSLIVWPHRNFRWLLILSIGSAYIHVKMATSYLSRNMITTRFRHYLHFLILLQTTWLSHALYCWKVIFMSNNLFLFSNKHMPYSHHPPRKRNKS